MTEVLNDPATPFAEVVLPIPVDRAFSYRVPAELSPLLVPGCRVRVPFRGRPEIGTCVGRTAVAPPVEAKSVTAVLDEHPVVDRGMLKLTRWIADYYRCSWGEALEAAVPAAVRQAATPRPEIGIALAVTPEAACAFLDSLPASRSGMRRILQARLEIDGVITRPELARHAGAGVESVRKLVERGLLKELPIPRGPDPISSVPVVMQTPPTLLPEQAAAVGWLEHAVTAERFQVALLFGITGSGKTEVYLRAIAAAVARGRQAIVLVPEIALTPQTVARFRARFDRVAVLHSGLAAAHRAREWERLRIGAADVVIGPRSAIFAPVPRPGLFVVDEEHETSYKQENTPRYHARDVAVMRGKMENVPVLLGSATPSLESYHNACTEKYTLLRLPVRAAGGALPPVEVIDMAGEATAVNALPVVSRQLDLLIRQCLEREQQVILFLNRRGFATLITCPSCKAVARCDRCSVALTFHRRRGRAECHYCREDRVAPVKCPECGHPNIRYLGMGTEKVEEVIQRMYPGFRVGRMDSDTMRGRDAHSRLLADVHSGEVDLLVGTQMVAKGHDVPNVTLVGVISGDTCLQLKDFRSAERTFQLIAQVSGRAGRGTSPGRVVVQTYNPGHYAIRYAVQHDYEGFARKELQLRAEMSVPPFGRLLRVIVEGSPEEAVAKEAGLVTQALQAELPRVDRSILGPSPAPISRLKDRFRWHILVKGDARRIRDAAQIAERHKLPGGRDWQLTVDVDPVSLL